MWQKLINASKKWAPILIICKKSMTNTWHINIRNTPTTSPTPTTIYPTFRALLLLGQLYIWIIIIQPRPHRTPVALFWDLFRGLHLTSWRWMACRRINYPHDLLGVSETLQPDYPRIPPDHGWSTFSAMTHSLQFSSTCVDRGPSLFLKKSPRDFVIKNLIASKLRGSLGKPMFSSTLQCDGVPAPS